MLALLPLDMVSRSLKLRLLWRFLMYICGITIWQKYVYGHWRKRWVLISYCLLLRGRSDIYASHLSNLSLVLMSPNILHQDNKNLSYVDSSYPNKIRSWICESITQLLKVYRAWQWIHAWHFISIQYYLFIVKDWYYVCWFAHD